EQRRERRIQIRRIELDAGKRRSSLKTAQLVVPVGFDVGPERIERTIRSDPTGCLGATCGPEDDLSARSHRHLWHRHDGALIPGIEYPQALKLVTKPLSSHR